MDRRSMRRSEDASLQSTNGLKAAVFTLLRLRAVDVGVDGGDPVSWISIERERGKSGGCTRFIKSAHMTVVDEEQYAAQPAPYFGVKRAAGGRTEACDPG